MERWVDRQAAQALRMRLDWKYALHLSLEDAGFDFSVLSEFRDQCLSDKVPFFFKQWGGVQKKKAGRILEGRTWDEMPKIMNLVRA
jgi:protein gp37